MNTVKKTWNILGFLSLSEKELEKQKEINGYPVMGTIDKMKDFPKAMFVFQPENWPKSNVIPRDRLATLVDPSTFVEHNAQIGAGTIIYPNCFVGFQAKVGDCILCLSGSIINHHNVIGDWTVINSGVTIAGVVTVEDEAVLGQCCNIRQYLRIGRNSFVGMSAVVLKDVPPNTVVVGNPARKLRDNPPRK
jgi:sugar O-acyltransferase (sialic acid O-acetyltransferase NeuD family)